MLLVQLVLNSYLAGSCSYWSFFFSSMIGFDPSTTNYPGKIPSGLDLPSDVVDEKAD